MLSYISRTAQVRRSALVACQPLERRMLLSLSPAGSEFRVNTFTTNIQTEPAIAADGDGDFVVVWQSFLQGEPNYGIYAQRYNSAGATQGTEFRVNTYLTNGQSSPAVAMDADGDFVVAWQSYTQDTSGYGIFAQRYNAVGVPQGSEFRVNTYLTNYQTKPAVAIDPAGNFVIAWQSAAQDGSAEGVYAQRYNFAGIPQGSEFRVNTYTTNLQAHPSAAMDAAGNFVIAWESSGQDGSGYGVYAQRYNSSGNAQGPEFKVHTFTTNRQSDASVAMDLTGDFVIAWESSGQDGSDFGIYAQRYNAAGAPQSGEFRVNTYTTNYQLVPSVAMDVDGDFLVTWQSYLQDGGLSGVYAQQYSAAGATIGGEFKVNTFTNSDQMIPAAAADHKGDYVIAWTSNTQEGPGSGYGVYARRYLESTDIAGPVVAGVFANGQPIAPAARLLEPVSSLVLSSSEKLSVAGGTSGPNSATNRANYILLRNGADISTQIVSVGFAFNSSSGKHETTLAMSPDLQGGSYLLTARDAINDLAGNALDGNLDGAAGGNFTRAFSIALLIPVGPEFRANTTTFSSQHDPSVAIDADGDFVVVWRSYHAGGDIYAQRYGANGQVQGSEFRVNSTTAGDQGGPAVAKDSDGNFVVVWHGIGPASSDIDIVAQRYNAAGVPQGGEFHVNTVATGVQRLPSIAMDFDGDFVIAWQSLDGFVGYGIFAQRFNAAGVAQGGQFPVNTFTTFDQHSASVAMDADGDFVVAWQSLAQDGSNDGIYAQRYNAAGVAQGGEFRVNTFTTGTQRLPSAATDASGDFVITWDGNGAGDDVGVFAQRFDAAGVAQGAEFRVNATTTLSQQQATVAMSPTGDFVIAWRNQIGDISFRINAQRFNAQGEAEGNEFQVSTFTTAAQGSPSVAMNADHDLVVAWQGQGLGDIDGIYGQRYARTLEVNISEFLFETAPHRVRFTFNDNVSASLSTDDLLLENLTTMQTIPSSQLLLAYDTGANTATFSYTGSGGGINGVLPDGDYRATLLASGITNAGGTPLAANHVLNFFFLNGDANHDARVNLVDFNTLAANFNQIPRNFTQGDFNFDSRVNIVDYNILAGRFGVALGPIAAVNPFASTTGSDDTGDDSLMRLLQ